MRVFFSEAVCSLARLMKLKLFVKIINKLMKERESWNRNQCSLKGKFEQGGSDQNVRSTEE